MLVHVDLNHIKEIDVYFSWFIAIAAIDSSILIYNQLTANSFAEYDLRQVE